MGSEGDLGSHARGGGVQTHFFVTKVVDGWVQLELSVRLLVLVFGSRVVVLDFVVFSVFKVLLLAVLVGALADEFPGGPLVKLDLLEIFVGPQHLDLAG